MSDLANFMRLFDDVGINYKIKESEDKRWGCFFVIELKVGEKENFKIDGYDGFINTFMFDQKEKFIKLNIWE